MNQDAKVIADLALQGADLVEGKDGVEYSRAPLYPVVYNPQPDALKVRTLTGLVDYAKNNAKEMSESGCFVIVLDARSVCILGGLARTMKRKLFVHAASSRESEFCFGRFMGHEEFLIKLNSLFVQSKGLTDLAHFISRIHADEGITTEDDGVTQKATLKSGLSGALKEGKPAPARVLLRPYRTFQEIAQPESEFLFRMKKDHQGVSCALFGCDGEAWEKECVNSLAKWLRDNLPRSVAVIC